MFSVVISTWYRLGDTELKGCVTRYAVPTRTTDVASVAVRWKLSTTRFTAGPPVTLTRPSQPAEASPTPQPSVRVPTASASADPRRNPTPEGMIRLPVGLMPRDKVPLEITPAVAEIVVAVKVTDWGSNATSGTDATFPLGGAEVPVGGLSLLGTVTCRVSSPNPVGR